MEVQLNNIERLLLRSSHQLEQVDRLLTYFTVFIPGQTPSMELLSEGIVSLSSILQTYKDQVLNKITQDSNRSLRSRYLNAEFKLHRNYRALAYALSVIKSTELFAEMAATKYRGQQGRWRAILGLEALKSLIRLGMLGLSKRALPSTVPVHESEYSQEEINSLIETLDQQGLALPKGTAPLDVKAPFRGANILKTPNVDMLRPPLELMKPLDTLGTSVEILSIIRPLIYAVLLYKYRNRKYSWTPWLVGASLEFAIQNFFRRCRRTSVTRMSGLENEVYSKREGSLLWWLMRDKMYEAYTRKVMMKFVRGLLKIPILSLGGHLLEDFLYLFDEYYFASASL